MSEKSANGDAGAVIQDQQMKETAAYLMRGRAFADLTVEDLEQRWVEAFRAFTAAGRPVDTDFDDVRAEYALRELELPMEKLAAEWRAFLAKIEAVEIPGRKDPH
ncbi:hypothetical protein [Phenylobacterium immobile]|uniref:hypothetical protein n=1 Tax=Phenylobacterium immobile TaxID=21 RepID=UPI000A9C3AA9|nr:hypothetical protein [Phenylobacterium immobile]